MVLTEEEKKLIDEGKISYTELIRKKNEEKPNVNLNELEEVKKQIREANLKYKEAIQKNKDLYAELEQSRKDKEVCRNEIAELRLKKKQILGIE